MIARTEPSYSIILTWFLYTDVHVKIPIAAQVTQTILENAVTLLQCAVKLGTSKIGFLQAIRSMYRMFCKVAEIPSSILWLIHRQCASNVNVEV